MSQPSQSCPDFSQIAGQDSSFDFSRILGGEKRKNPFVKNALEKQPKVVCAESERINLDESEDKTLFQLLRLSNSLADSESTQPKIQIPTSFTNILSNPIQSVLVENDNQSCKQKRIPLDWSLKTRMRLMSAKPFAWNQKLKASEEASGITGFVRCLDTSNSCTLDTSHHARFHQNCLYWQHPSLPWLSLFPRCSGRISKVNYVSNNEDIVGALHREWSESFRSLFQLLRARQCPYFYVCANTFTCMFHAAGISGSVETSVFIAPTTRGFRQTLKKEEIEFTMPLKKSSLKRKSSDLNSKPTSSDSLRTKNSSFDSCYDTMDDNVNEDDKEKCEDGADDDSGEDEMESDEWLESLGVAAEEIKKINHSQLRMNQAAESAVDNGSESLVYIQGVDVQALFNFLLNCKSCIPATGAFGGIPPTLLAPTAFQGGSLQPLKVRESVVLTDEGKYHSIELRGPILPSTVHSLCSLLQNNANSFSATFANLKQTASFSEAARVISDDEKSKESASSTAPSVFGRENLSDCGLSSEVLQVFCSSETKRLETIDSLKYCSEKSTYLWS